MHGDIPSPWCKRCNHAMRISELHLSIWKGPRTSVSMSLKALSACNASPTYLSTRELFFAWLLKFGDRPQHRVRALVRRCESCQGIHQGSRGKSEREEEREREGGRVARMCVV